MTDSVGSRSDTSGQGPGPVAPVITKFRMDSVCVIDLQRNEHLTQRKKALEEVRQACALVNANSHHVQVFAINFSFISILAYNYCI